MTADKNSASSGADNSPFHKRGGGSGRRSAPQGRKSMRAKRINLKGLVKPQPYKTGMKLTPKEVFSTSAHDEMMDRATSEMNDNQHSDFQDDSGELSFHGVPLNEDLELSPEMIEEYCEREPFLLTSPMSMAGNAKFGIIPARFKAQADAFEEEMEIIELARSTPENRKNSRSGQTLVSLDKVQNLASMFHRVSEGDTLDAEYEAAEKGYTEYMEAYKVAADIYHRQMRETAYQLSTKLSRRDIALYAQNMWLNNYKRNEDVHCNTAFFTHDVSEQPLLLQKCAHNTALAALKWMALVINEMPMNQGMDKPGSYDVAPK